MKLRLYRLDEAYEQVIRRARFRAPQRAAFDRVYQVFRGLDEDLGAISKDRLREHLRHAGFHVIDGVPYFVFHLATGVGKTRLMGAIISFLFLSGQSKNVLILAPRTAILDRLEALAQADSDKYLFLDPDFVPEPNLCFRANLDTFQPSNSTPNVVILSPQSISGGDRRFGRASEFKEHSLENYIRKSADLVVFTDESHHIGSDDDAGWREAINALGPKVHFGLSATPRVGAGVNVLYSYDLITCLQEGLYTKGVEIIVDERDQGTTDDEWDRYTLDYALRRLDRKREALSLYAEQHLDFEYIEPVALVCAKDIEHAEQIANWLVDRRGLTAGELLVTHSKKTQTEEDIARLTAIDKPGNRIKVVVNVFQLTEGWDVTNVYVIAPLRAMATFQNAVQTMGRGLRLPAGRRLGNPDIDTLDVLCFGRETLEGILTEATQILGTGKEGGPAVDVVSGKQKESDENPIPKKEFLIRCLQEEELVIPNVRRVPADFEIDFDITSLGSLSGGAATAIDLASLEATGVEERIGYDLEDVIRIASAMIVAQLRYLSDFKHGIAVEGLVRRFLESLGATSDQPVFVEPMKLALHICGEIDARFRKQVSDYEAVANATVVKIGDIKWRVPDDFAQALDRMPVDEWTR